MATKTTRISTVKAKTAKTTAPRTARTRTRTATVATREEIALRAYERFCARGCEHGLDVEDWLAAEQELLTTA
jgi:hypothetical protein